MQLFSNSLTCSGKMFSSVIPSWDSHDFTALFRQMVLSAFRGVQLPGSMEPPTPATVDQFVAKLHSLTEKENATAGQQALLTTVKDVVSRMDFSKIPA